jgi:hypothetical protein
MDVMPKHTRTPHPHILELAKLGAEVHLRDLAQEVKNLLDLFPHLRDSYDKDELPIRFIMAKESGHATKRSAEPAKRRRLKMSDAGKKAVSERMTKYWAARRKATKA